MGNLGFNKKILSLVGIVSFSLSACVEYETCEVVKPQGIYVCENLKGGGQYKFDSKDCDNLIVGGMTPSADVNNYSAIKFIDLNSSEKVWLNLADYYCRLEQNGNK